LYFWTEEWTTTDFAPKVYKESTPHRNIESTGEYLKQQEVSARLYTYAWVHLGWEQGEANAPPSNISFLPQNIFGFGVELGQLKMTGVKVTGRSVRLWK